MKKEIKVIASTHISNTSGIYVHEIDDSLEYVVYSIVGMNSIYKKPKKVKLYYNYTKDDGQYYFYIRKQKHDLDDFMRTSHNLYMTYDTKKDNKEIEYNYK